MCCQHAARTTKERVSRIDSRICDDDYLVRTAERDWLSGVSLISSNDFDASRQLDVAGTVFPTLLTASSSNSASSAL
jgi:hypothetical protein